VIALPRKHSGLIFRGNSFLVAALAALRSFAATSNALFGSEGNASGVALLCVLDESISGFQHYDNHETRNCESVRIIGEAQREYLADLHSGGFSRDLCDWRDGRIIRFPGWLLRFLSHLPSFHFQVCVFWQATVSRASEIELSRCYLADFCWVSGALLLFVPSGHAVSEFSLD
jgi:hypothetical protein